MKKSFERQHMLSTGEIVSLEPTAVRTGLFRENHLDKMGVHTCSLWDEEPVLRNYESVFPFQTRVCWRAAIQFSIGLAFLILFPACGVAFAQNPTTPQSSLDQAEALLNQGKPGDALSLLTALAEKDPKAPGLQRKIGKAHFRLRQ